MSQPRGEPVLSDALVERVRREGFLGPWRAAANRIGISFDEYANGRLNGFHWCFGCRKFKADVNASNACVKCSRRISNQDYQKNHERRKTAGRLRQRILDGVSVLSVKITCPGCLRSETTEIAFSKRRNFEEAKNRARNGFAAKHSDCFRVEVSE